MAGNANTHFRLAALGEGALWPRSERRRECVRVASMLQRRGSEGVELKIKANLVSVEKTAKRPSSKRCPLRSIPWPESVVPSRRGLYSCTALLDPPVPNRLALN